MNLLLLAALTLGSPCRSESFQAWNARAARAERRKDYRAALDSYSSAIASWKPGDGAAPKGRAYCARASLRERKGDSEGALKDYSDCVALDKKNAKGFHKRGRLLLREGKTRAALDDFYSATKIDIRFGQAYADRGRAYEILGDRAFAREDYRQACRLGVAEVCAKSGRLAPPKKTAKKPAAAPKPKPKPKPHAAGFTACLNALKTCSEAEAYGVCIDKTPVCEREPVRGCCPQACVAAFHGAVGHGDSEASAFRAVFQPGAACAAAPVTAK